VAQDRFWPGAICGLSLLLVVIPVQEFFSGTSGFLRSRGNQHFKIPVQAWRVDQQETQPGLAWFSLFM